MYHSRVRIPSLNYTVLRKATCRNEQRESAVGIPKVIQGAEQEPLSRAVLELPLPKLEHGSVYLRGPCVASAVICLPKRELLHSEQPSRASPPAPRWKLAHPPWHKMDIVPFEINEPYPLLLRNNIRPGHYVSVLRTPSLQRSLGNLREVKRLNYSRTVCQIPHLLGETPPSWSTNHSIILYSSTNHSIFFTISHGASGSAVTPWHAPHRAT